MPIIKDYQVLISHTRSKHDTENIVITYISLSEEERIDKGEEITVDRGDCKFNIGTKNVYCYGEIDFSDNSEDLDVIEGFDWFNDLSFKGKVIPSDYDYDTHCCYSPNPTYRWCETWSSSVVAQFCHATLDKPKRCAIFKTIRI